MESTPETGREVPGESAKKSHTNYPWLHKFELRGKVEKAWTNNTGEMRSRGDLIEAYKIIEGKESIHWERFFELISSKVTRGHKLFKKRKETLRQTFFNAS